MGKGETRCYRVRAWIKGYTDPGVARAARGAAPTLHTCQLVLSGIDDFLPLSPAASQRLSNRAHALASTQALLSRNLPPQKHSNTVDKGTGLAQIEKAPPQVLPFYPTSYDDPP